MHARHSVAAAVAPVVQTTKFRVCTGGTSVVVGSAVLVLAPVFLSGIPSNVADERYGLAFVDGREDQHQAWLQRVTRSCADTDARTAISIFNVTNAEAVASGAKPVLQELPPIVICVVSKHVQVDPGRLGEGLLRYRRTEEALLDGTPPLSLEDVVVVPNFRYGALHARGLSFPSTLRDGIFPLFVRLTVAQLLGWQGAALELPAFGSLTLGLLRSVADIEQAAWTEVNVGTPRSGTGGPRDPAATVPGFWTLVGDLGNASYSCAYDRDCVAQAGYAERRDVDGCTPAPAGSFCDPGYIAGYSGAVLPSGSFLDYLSKERPYNYNGWAMKGAKVALWFRDIQKQVLFENAEEVELKGIWLHRWLSVGAGRRTESCGAVTGDSPGYDCDAPRHSVHVGPSFNESMPPPIYLTQPYFNTTELHRDRHVASPQEPGWDPRDRVTVNECAACASRREREEERNEFVTETYTDVHFGSAVKSNKAMQFNMRMAWPSAYGLYPAVQECLVPVVFSRTYEGLTDAAVSELTSYSSRITGAAGGLLLLLALGAGCVVLGLMCALEGVGHLLRTRAGQPESDDEEAESPALEPLAGEVPMQAAVCEWADEADVPAKRGKAILSL